MKKCNNKLAMLVFTLVLSIFILICFGIIRLLDNKKLEDKKKELLQFLVVYTVALLFLRWLSLYFLAKVTAGENWHIHFYPLRDQLMMAAFYVPPTFLIAYLLYPFKIIKRNRILLWILLVYTLIVLGGSTLVNIWVAFSNM